MAFTFLQSASDGTDATVYTFTAQNLGTAADNRYIIVSVSSRRAGSPLTISSMTIGGVAATEVVQRSSGGSNIDVAGIFIALVPTGTTGDIVVTLSTGCARCAIGAYRAVDIANPTAYATANSIASNPTCTLNIPAGGFAIGVSFAGSNGTTTWTGLTEDYDVSLESVSNASGASASFTTQQTGLTITADPTGTTDPVGVFASWWGVNGNFFQLF